MYILVFWSIMLPPSLEYKSTGFDVVGLHGKGEGNKRSLDFSDFLPIVWSTVIGITRVLSEHNVNTSQ